MKNGNQKQWGAEDPSDSPVDQASAKKPKKPTQKAIDPDAVLPKKKSQQSSGKKATLSPIQQIMKAVTASAINPPKKKAPKIPNGPSKSNLKKPQDKGRIDNDDGPSASKKGMA